MITALSEILRYSLESSKKDRVRLEEELIMLDRYIAVIKLQFERRLSFSVSITPTLRSFKVPPMILQLIVENAIKHGFEKLKGGGELKLMGREFDGGALFCIENPKPLHDDSAPRKQGTKTGLANIRQRLNILYGRGASLETSTTASTFKVEIILPGEHEI